MLAVRNQFGSRGMGWVAVLIVAAIILIAAPIVMWLVHTTIELVMLAVKLGVAVLLLLLVVAAIKTVSKNV